MQQSQPIFACDSPGCRSRCTLDIDEPEIDKALRLRGWVVDGRQHFCPPCGTGLNRTKPNTLNVTPLETPR